jgi:demethylmenaquinone methyltransferase / 2-methoxy-6-polyprenyl-1,4-benzoquinol methylase
MSPHTKPAPLAGTRPAGARDEREAALHVRDMFSRIAPRYDFLNHLLSFSLDRVWRRRTARELRHILERADARVLDLCCGTGDLAFALDRARARSVKGGGRLRASVIGSDFAQPMLERAREKAANGNRAAVFVTADALQLPFADGSFDLVASAFGFRNLANYEEGLREIARVLRRRGEAGILEFSEPQSGVMAGAFRFYFENILPFVGGAISGNREAYAYLPGSVAKFPPPAELGALMEKAGFERVRMRMWNFGSVVLLIATRK